jgi:hypothetical protein
MFHLLACLVDIFSFRRALLPVPDILQANPTSKMQERYKAFFVQMLTKGEKEMKTPEKMT